MGSKGAIVTGEMLHDNTSIKKIIVAGRFNPPPLATAVKTSQLPVLTVEPIVHTMAVFDWFLLSF